MKSFASFLLFFCSLFLSLPVLAQTQIEFDGETASFIHKKIKLGAVEIKVSYEKIEDYSTDKNNFSYQIFYGGIPQVNESTLTNYGKVFLQDLDKNGTPEAIIETFSGGAHCCLSYLIYSWQKNKFIVAKTGYLDGGGGKFEDLDKDGKVEFLTRDNAFYYAFSSYAGSYPPAQILRFKNGKLNDVTRQYKKFLRQDLAEMEKAFWRAKKENYEVNGILASYVAQRALLGQFQQGWNFMLAHYDRTSDWGLPIYKDSREVSKYPDFPTALKAFLAQNGYLNSPN